MTNRFPKALPLPKSFNTNLMTIIIPKNASAAEVDKQIRKAGKSKGKGFDAVKHAGKVKWEQDPLAYQQEIRSE